MELDPRMQKVKDRIRKLLAIAADDTAVDGEITAAMALAEAAMEKYHLDRADVEVEAEATATSKPVEMARNSGRGLGVRITDWERTLAGAVRTLIGSIGVYHEMKPLDVFKSKKQSVLTWYGPAEDIALAQELYEEWARVISTMAYGKYRTALKGDGLRYCYGFASALQEKALAEAEKRKVVVTASTTAIVKAEGGSLADVLRKKQELAKQWLGTTHGVKLYKHTSRVTLRRGSEQDALEAGRADGAQADFSVTRTKKLN